MHKQNYLISFAVYPILLVFSILFYKERIAFTDLAFHLFNIISTKTFTIQNYRFGAIGTQIFPVISRWLHLSLNTIMLIYSMGFIVYYGLCYFLCGVVFKNYKLGLVVLFINILFASHTFYWAQSELPQGLTFMLVYFSFITGKQAGDLSAWSLSMVFFCIFTIAFFHPLIIFPFTYLILYFLLNKNSNISPKLLYASLLFFIITIILKKVAFPVAYDQQSIGGLKHFVQLFPHYFTLYSDKRLLHNCITHYYWMPILSLFIFITYCMNRAWKKLLLFCVFLFCFILLVNVSYPNSDTTAFYIENLYLPISIIIGVPFVYDVIPLLDKKKISLAVMLAILVTGCVRIYSTHNLYTGRLNWERRFLNANLNNKLVLSNKYVPMDTLLMTWATPYEFWLLSTTEHHQTASIIITDDINSFLGARDVKDKFIGPWWATPYSELDPKYFIFKDTVNTYKIVQ